jgi:hypothetical protein
MVPIIHKNSQSDYSHSPHAHLMYSFETSDSLDRITRMNVPKKVQRSTTPLCFWCVSLFFAQKIYERRRRVSNWIKVAKLKCEHHHHLALATHQRIERGQRNAIKDDIRRSSLKGRRKWIVASSLSRSSRVISLPSRNVYSFTGIKIIHNEIDLNAKMLIIRTIKKSTESDSLSSSSSSSSSLNSIHMFNVWKRANSALLSFSHERKKKSPSLDERKKKKEKVCQFQRSALSVCF